MTIERERTLSIFFNKIDIIGQYDCSLEGICNELSCMKIICIVRLLQENLYLMFR